MYVEFDMLFFKDSGVNCNMLNLEAKAQLVDYGEWGEGGGGGQQSGKTAGTKLFCTPPLRQDTTFCTPFSILCPPYSTVGVNVL